jgi:hypothetical protein
MALEVYSTPERLLRMVVVEAVVRPTQCMEDGVDYTAVEDFQISTHNTRMFIMAELVVEHWPTLTIMQ